MGGRRKNAYPLIRHDIAAQFHAGLTITSLRGRPELPPGATAERVGNLPLIVRTSQWAHFADRYYFLRREGLYRFWGWGKAKWIGPLERPEVVDEHKRYGCVILFRKDILKLLGAIATLHVHGISHTRLPHEERITKLKQGNLSLRCGDIASFISQLLTDMGWRTRLIHCCRTEGEYDTYDCGHCLFEFYWPEHRKWVLADVDTHQMFVKNGMYLNAADIRELLERGETFSLEPLTVPGIGSVDTSDAVAGRFSGDAYANPIYVDMNLLMAWYERIFGMMAVCAEGGSYFTCSNPADRDRLCRYSSGYKPMEKREWLKRFYGWEKG